MAVLEIEDRDDGIRILWMNRPDKRNALSGELIEALDAAFTDAEADRDVRVIVLAGRGKAFCAGGDLSSAFAQGDGGLLASEQARGAYARLLGRIPRLGRPVIAAVQGKAMGGGIGLVAACDLAVVDCSARLGTPEVNIGLFPYVITAALQRNVPRKALMELMLTGGSFSADEAVAYGLANHVAEEGEVLDRALALAKEIASKSRAVIQAGKQAFELAADLPYERALEVLNHRLTVGVLLEDAGEGVSAFLQKRRPDWKDR